MSIYNNVHVKLKLISLACIYWLLTENTFSLFYFSNPPVLEQAAQGSDKIMLQCNCKSTP